MVGAATKVATLPLRRRLIGAGIMLVGILLVGLGFFVNLYGKAPADAHVVVTPKQLGALQIPFSSHNAAGILQHAFDHGLFTANTVRELSDVAVRGGVILMAVAAGIALITVFIPPLRGFAGTAAGLGLFGDAALAGVLFGENARLSVDFGHNPQISVDMGTALWVFAIGFGIILVGGALAAWRPLAGVFSGLGLALSGAGLGASLAFVVGGNHLLTGLIGR